MGSHQALRVCHLASGDLWAGAEVQILNMATQLALRDDIEVSTVLLNPGRLAEELRRAGVMVTVIDENDFGFMAIQKQLTNYFETHPVDILHTHRYKENILGAQQRRRGRVPCLVQTVHGLGEPFHGLRRLKTALTSTLNRRIAGPQFDAVIAVSDDIRAKLIPLYGDERIVTVHNGINLETVRASRPVEQVKQELGIPIDAPLIGTAGRMVPVKGYDFFLHAARQVLQKHPETCFLLAGDGPMLAELKALAAGLDISNRVVFTGHREDIYNILQAMDLFVMSSHHEGIPSVLLEAMALRRPVVVTAVGGMVEVVEDGVSGLLIRPGQADLLASACDALLKDTSRRRKLGERASQRVRKHFSSQAQAEKIAEIYRRIHTAT